MYRPLFYSGPENREKVMFRNAFVCRYLVRSPITHLEISSLSLHGCSTERRRKTDTRSIFSVTLTVIVSTAAEHFSFFSVSVMSLFIISINKVARFKY